MRVFSMYYELPELLGHAAMLLSPREVAVVGFEFPEMNEVFRRVESGPTNMMAIAWWWLTNSSVGAAFVIITETRYVLCHIHIWQASTQPTCQIGIWIRQIFFAKSKMPVMTKSNVTQALWCVGNASSYVVACVGITAWVYHITDCTVMGLWTLHCKHHTAMCTRWRNDFTMLTTHNCTEAY